MASLTIQPGPAAGHDTYIDEDLPTLNFGTCDYLLLRNVSNTIAKASIEFDCSSIPGDATCNSATLYLYHYEAARGAYNGSVWSIAVGNAAWPEGTHCGGTGGANDCCWDHLDQASGTETDWAGSPGLETAVTDYETPAIGTFALTGDEGVGDEEPITLNAARVQGWFGAVNTNYGILVTTTANDRIKFCSSDHVTAPFRPKLVVNYTEATTSTSTTTVSTSTTLTSTSSTSTSLSTTSSSTTSSSTTSSSTTSSSLSTTSSSTTSTSFSTTSTSFSTTSSSTTSTSHSTSTSSSTSTSISTSTTSTSTSLRLQFWHRYTGTLKKRLHKKPWCFPWYLAFDGADSILNCGSDGGLDDIPAGGNGQITADGWVRSLSTGELSTGVIMQKADNPGNTDGWVVRVQANGLEGRINAATDARSVSGTDEFDPTDGIWHHVAMTYDKTGASTPAAKTIYLAVDGGWVTSYTAQIVGALPYSVDNAQDLTIGNNTGVGRTFDGDIGWMRVSNNIRFAVNTDFTPPERCELPTIDANTLGQWIGPEWTGATIDNQEGTAARDGTQADCGFNCDCWK